MNPVQKNDFSGTIVNWEEIRAVIVSLIDI